MPRLSALCPLPGLLLRLVFAEKRVLVVEDEPAWRLAIEKRLRLELFQTCGTGRQAHAFELMRTWRPDLVVLDLALDGPLAGMDLLRAKNREPRTAAIPVLVVTACRDREALAGIHVAGATACLSKPFQPERLSALARNLMRRRVQP
jgi:two-component system phosphate regulon response regulator PhoB